MRIEIFVQARMGSTRLPGKILKQVLGKPLLLYQIERLKEVTLADCCRILTTTEKADDQIVSFCKDHGIPVFRGPEEDVLSRYHQAALEYRPDAIVRVSSDCPLIDPKVVNDIIRTYRDGFPQWEYVSNCITRTFPRGLDAEIFSFEALDKAFRLSIDKGEREHVTLHMYRHPELYRLRNVTNSEDLSDYRWTVDTTEDFELIKRILEHLYPRKPDFRMQDVLQLLNEHPDWKRINEGVKQKEV